MYIYIYICIDRNVLYFILREFMGRSLTPAKGRSLTPFRDRAHGSLPHFESDSSTEPMGRSLTPFMRRSLTPFIGGLLSIFSMDPCPQFSGVEPRVPRAISLLIGPVKTGALIGTNGMNIADVERRGFQRIKILCRRKDDARRDFVVIQGPPSDVEHWAQVLLQKYGVNEGKCRGKDNHSWQNYWQDCEDWVQNSQWNSWDHSKGGQNYSNGSSRGSRQAHSKGSQSYSKRAW